MTTTSDAVKKYQHAVKRKAFLYETIASQEAGEMTPRLAELLTDMVQRYATRSRYSDYEFNEDMQAHALAILCRTWNKFCPDKSDNAFAYYHQGIIGAFVNYIAKERKQREIKKDYEEYLDCEQHF